MNKSLYIHIPFCRQKCFYCGFYSISYRRAYASSYIDILCRQIDPLEGDFSTIFIGGGTPSVLEWPLLAKLLKSLRRFLGPDVEFTVEANPESWNEEKAKLFFDEGCRRVSIGVQSLCPQKLAKLGRGHNVEQALAAVFTAERIGFSNISIDLIFGVEGEDLDDWRKELARAVTLPVKHISTYGLSCEKNTPYYKTVQDGRIKLLDDTTAARMYMLSRDYLPAQGFLQYEVSNFAQEGYQCRHNVTYWHNNPYLGLGPSAVSYLDGIRVRNISSVKSYIEKTDRGQDLAVFRETLSATDRAKETAALMIRMKEGINFDVFSRQCGVDFLKLTPPALEDLIKDDLLEYKEKDGRKTGVSLTKKGFLFCDSVSSAFL